MASRDHVLRPRIARVCTTCRRIPRQTRARHRRAGARRRQRYPDAFVRAEAHRGAGPRFRRRESHAGGGVLSYRTVATAVARRLHAARNHRRIHHPPAVHAESRLRSREGFRADIAGRPGAISPARASIAAGENRAEIARSRKSAAGRDRVWIGRAGLVDAPRVRALHDARSHRHDARSIQGYRACADRHDVGTGADARWATCSRACSTRRSASCARSP